MVDIFETLAALVVGERSLGRRDEVFGKLVLRDFGDGPRRLGWSARCAVVEGF
jgi:hypothetical protein